jgi:hypothetical protein
VKRRTGTNSGFGRQGGVWESADPAGRSLRIKEGGRILSNAIRNFACLYSCAEVDSGNLSVYFKLLWTWCHIGMATDSFFPPYLCSTTCY